MVYKRESRDLLLRHPTYPDIFRYAPSADRIQFLMNHGYSCFQTLTGIIKVYFFSFKIHLSLIRIIQAESTFHQSRFPRAVFSHQSMYRSWPQRKRNAVQCLYTRKAFADVFHFQYDTLIFHTVFSCFCLYGHPFAAAARRACRHIRPEYGPQK